jgi:Acidobacterial duplicated orphan permease
MNIIANRLAENYPATNAGWTTKVTLLRRQLLGDSRLALLALFGAVGFVLVIACFNVGNLLFARAVSRRKEISIRTALGAGRKRLFLQFLTESLLLTFSAGIIGFLLAWWATKLAVLLLPNAAGGIGGGAIGVSTMGLLFTLGVSVLTGVVFGVAPALTSSQVNLNQALRDSARGMSEGRKLRGFRSFLTAAQVALSLVLLVGAGLLLKSFARLQNEQLGFQTANLLTMKLSLSSNRYDEVPARAATFEKLLEQVSTVPGVKSAAIIPKLPLEAGTAGLNTFEIEGQSNSGIQRDMPVAFERPTSGSYFETMGIPLVRGRTFTRQDTADAPLVAIVDESAVQRYWPNEDPIGRHIYYTRRSKRLSLEIVGIVGSVKHNYLDPKMAPTIYRPMGQDPWSNMSLIVRTSVDPKSLTEAIARAVRSVDPDLPVASVRTMDEIASETAWRLRFVMSLLSAFAVMAVGLAALGVYGVLNYNVTQRMREMAIRMSLGASPADVFRIIISNSLFLVLTGLAAGTAIALWLSRFLASFLYGVTALDLTIYLSVALVMTAVGLLAALVPARRATKVDPGLVLRPE